MARAALSLALLVGLLNVLLPATRSWMQVGLFISACILNLPAKRWKWTIRILRWLALPFLAQAYYQLTVNPGAAEEIVWLRYIHRSLLLCIFLAPYSRCRTESDLSGFALLVLCVFFFSAAFMHTSFFLVGLLAATLLVLVAFNEQAVSRRGGPAMERLRGNLRLAVCHLSLASGVVLVAFLLFPRSLFLQQADALKLLVRHRIQTASDSSPPLTQLGVDPRRDLLQLTNLHELARTSEEVLQAKLFLASNDLPYLSARPLYFRASLYATYRDGAWTNTLKPVSVSDSDDGRPDGWIRLRIPNDLSDRLRVRQRIRTKPIGDLCFCLPDPLAVNTPKMKWTDQSLLQFTILLRMEREYTVVSALPPAWDSAAVSNVTEITQTPELAPYLEVPPQLKTMLLRWRPEIGNVPAPWARVEQIRRILEKEYSYALGPFTPGDHMDPVEYFLFEQKSGYCTHFATALALLARAYGVPARVATGFCTASPPNSEGILVIRDHNAHAWTEVYVAGQGWIICDATPAAYMPPFSPNEGFSAMTFITSTMTWLNDFLSEFDASLQGDLAKSLVKLPVRLCRLGVRGLASPWTWACLLVILVASRKALQAVTPAQRRRWRRRLSGGRFDSSVAFYDDFLWLMARAGLPKASTVTGREFAQEALLRFPRPEISWLTEHFYRSKYGRKPLSPEVLDQAERHLQSLEQSIQDPSLTAPGGYR
jgi:hypothetical protein